jgi:glycerophosphoryl diester phosphodiesterase
MRTKRSKWLWGLIGVVVALAAIVAVLVLLAQPAAGHPFFARFEQRPLVMAHRGGKGLWPENTLYAFEQAVDMGVDVLEMDIHSTSDGALVVMHDGTVDRTTNGSGPVQALTLEELQALDAGYTWSTDEGPTWPYRGQGIRVPALAEVFARFPDAPMNIEIKQAEPSLAGPLCQTIREYRMADHVLVASFHERAMREFREACPEIATTAGMNEVIVLFATSKVHLEAAYGSSAEAVQVPEYRSGLHVITPRFIDAAHRRNLEVHVWTINDVDDLRRMIDLGVDGIITDYPDRLMELVGR